MQGSVLCRLPGPPARRMMAEWAGARHAVPEGAHAGADADANAAAGAWRRPLREAAPHARVPLLLLCAGEPVTLAGTIE